MSWQRPTNGYTCGACGTRITGLLGLSEVRAIMQEHAILCPGYPPEAQPSVAQPEPPLPLDRTLSPES